MQSMLPEVSLGSIMKPPSNEILHLTLVASASPIFLITALTPSPPLWGHFEVGFLKLF